MSVPMLSKLSYAGRQAYHSLYPNWQIFALQVVYNNLSLILSLFMINNLPKTTVELLLFSQKIFVFAKSCSPCVWIKAKATHHSPSRYVGMRYNLCLLFFQVAMKGDGGRWTAIVACFWQNFAGIPFPLLIPVLRLLLVKISHKP